MSLFSESVVSLLEFSMSSGIVSVVLFFSELLACELVLADAFEIFFRFFEA